MNYTRTTPTPKGQFKCFHCRLNVKSKDGAWSYVDSQQVFLCKPCEHLPKSVPAAATDSL